MAPNPRTDNKKVRETWTLWTFFCFIFLQFIPRLRKAPPPPARQDQLKDKNVIIIGNGTLGTELATKFAVSGAKLHIACSKNSAAATRAHILQELKWRGVPHEDISRQTKRNDSAAVTLEIPEKRIDCYETDLSSRTGIREFVTQWQDTTTGKIDILVFCTGLPMCKPDTPRYAANGLSKMYMLNFITPFILLWLLEGYLAQNARVLSAGSFLHNRGTWRHLLRKSSRSYEESFILKKLIAKIFYCLNLDFLGFGPRSNLSDQGYRKLTERKSGFLARHLLFWPSLGFLGSRPHSDIQLYANMKLMQATWVKMLAQRWTEEATPDIIITHSGPQPGTQISKYLVKTGRPANGKNLQVHTFNLGLPLSNCLIWKVDTSKLWFQPTWDFLQWWCRMFGEGDRSRIMATAYWLATTDDPKVVQNSGGYWDGMECCPTTAAKFNGEDRRRLLQMWEKDAGIDLSIPAVPSDRRLVNFSRDC